MTDSPTNVKLVHLVVLDKSTSMNTVRSETIRGVNNHIRSLKDAEEEGQDTEFCSVLFSDHHRIEEVHWRVPLSEVEEFTETTYRPSGMTALNDAVGFKVTKLRDELQDLLDKDEATILVTIFTDGNENDSREFRDGTLVAKLMKEVQDTGRWTVAFVGCGDNVFAVARKLNIDAGSVARYAAGGQGTQAAMNAVACSAASYSKSVRTRGLVATRGKVRRQGFFSEAPKSANLEVGQVDTAALKEMKDKNKKSK